MLKMHQKAFDGHTPSKPAGELTALSDYIDFIDRGPRGGKG